MDFTVDSPRIALPAPPAEQQRSLDAGGVAVWRADLSIPTYEPEEADRFPMFLDRRIYQGSSGRVYPLPFVERVATEPVDRHWNAVHIENRWIRLVLLPELGQQTACALWTAIEEKAALLGSTATVDYFATSLPALLLFADDVVKTAQITQHGLLARLAKVHRTAPATSPTPTTRRES